ncbi:unnamed protein product [Moneuplotes crassus]|uniref:Uncharacterized protein n=1 Tax=Euplotes crassus TaxID=5936 RepID=A0AAD1UM69_EUPCR|nr:unnamed protein product [Moneuplotes crassus]
MRRSVIIAPKKSTLNEKLKDVMNQKTSRKSSIGASKGAKLMFSPQRTVKMQSLNTNSSKLEKKAGVKSPDEFRKMIKNAMNKNKKSIREMKRDDFIKVMKSFGYHINQVQAIEAFIEFQGSPNEPSREVDFNRLLKWIELNIHRIKNTENLSRKLSSKMQKNSN